jgi:hypothetical protein
MLRLLAALAFAAMICAAYGQTGQSAGPPRAEPGDTVDTLKDFFERLHHCWKPPATPGVSAMDITVIVSFNRSGEILGRPRISYESAQATDQDRLAYRIAVMEALQRCTPMPFTETMAGAVAGRPFAIQFHNVKLQREKRVWLSPKIL